MTEILPTLPGCANGVIGRGPFKIQCQECGIASESRSAILALDEHQFGFHPWRDGTNPRLCRECRLARGCQCMRCQDERNEP